ncbi:AraC family transcriptional regulator [Chitinophaga silvatica]|uniref:AraC family transcriptional regulator n=1 Tax=Chitinophaga silvatica TaxID=2282649 RepID=A0A3E1Y7N5_9BACT|nr:AraC family transcriptional regulator [Chitinophaga silvatica]RFS20743.1 AraC family transcriptional regulator [Chitinophaga silvatica]
MNIRRSRKDFPIEADIQEFHSIDDLPGEFLPLLTNDSKFILNADEDVEMVHQVMRLGDMSLWLHDIFPRTNLHLVPFSDRKVISFQFHAKNMILNDLDGGLPYKALDREVLIYQIEDGTAPDFFIDDSEVVVRVNVNMDKKDFIELAKFNPYLQQVADMICDTTTTCKQLNPTYIRITKFVEWMTETMCKFPGKGLPATLLYRRCAINMMINAAIQFRQPHLATYQVPSYLQTVLPAALKYLESNLKQPLDLTKMAAQLGTFPIILHRTFYKAFLITPSQYQMHYRLLKAMETIWMPTTKLENIVDTYGFTSVQQLRSTFLSYYSCSIENLRNNQ